MREPTVVGEEHALGSGAVSLLDVDGGPVAGAAADVPPFFVDLLLSHLLDAVRTNHDVEWLRPLFSTAIPVETALFRHEVFRDLEEPAIFDSATGFAADMRRMRECLAHAARVGDHLQRLGWTVEAAVTYCDALPELVRRLEAATPRSRGLNGLLRYLYDYLGSDRFCALATDVGQARAALGRVRYAVEIDGLSVRVREHDGSPDLGSELLATFADFRGVGPRSSPPSFSGSAELNSVEARILALVARLFTDEFSTAQRCLARHPSVVDDSVERLDRELSFYLSYLEYLAPLRSADLSFCYPELRDDEDELLVVDAFDLVLAHRLVGQRRRVVRNDLHLAGRERIVIVTGPNQSGKTTFARMIGQIHHLASIGCPVPGDQARIGLPDHLFTHFGRDDASVSDLGRLEDDLIRLREILPSATSRSLLIANEVFSSTTLEDAEFLLAEAVRTMDAIGLRCVWVTFLSAAAERDTVVSIASDPTADGSLEATYTFSRRRPDGLRRAQALAERHSLLPAQLAARLRR